MKLQNHEVGILIVLLTLLQSWQYFPVLVLIAIYKIITRGGRIPRKPTLVLLPLLLMIAVGLVFAHNNNSYEALKDFWYISKVILSAFVGIIIGFTSKQNSKFLRIIAIYAGLALTIELVLFGLTSMSDPASDLLPALLPILVVFFYLGSASERPFKNLKLKLVLGALVLAVLLFSLSRTMFLAGLIAWFGAAGFFANRVKIVLGAVVFTAAIMIFAPMLPQYDPSNITFLGKVQNSLSEIGFVDDDDMTRITANWRGFEAYRAYETWLAGSFAQKFFGQGLGATIDIGFYYSLSEDYSVRNLPVLHNGYFMVLVKFGILGVALLFFFMALPFFFRARRNDLYSTLAQNIGLTASVLLLITTVSITGPLNLSKLDGVTLMLGWAMGTHFQIRLLSLTERRKGSKTVEVPDAPYPMRG